MSAKLAHSGSFTENEYKPLQRTFITINYKHELNFFIFFYYFPINFHMIDTFSSKLQDQSIPVGERYQSVFELKNIGTYQAIEALMKAYESCGTSVLLKHQLLYALGQLPAQKYAIVKNFLIEKVNDETENNLSRHEAAQALANYFKQEIIPLYEAHLDSTCKQLKWTCQIAVEKVKHSQMKELYGNKYHSTMEPAAPFTQNQFKSYLQKNGLEQIFEAENFKGLLLRELPLFDKYRIMYLMRDLNTEECRKTLCELLSLQYFKTQTSLLKHEICFIIGQIGCENYEHLIRECIENDEEEDIVRHEALAAVASQSKDPIYLQKFIDHPSQLIRESALVAIHTIKYWSE